MVFQLGWVLLLVKPTVFQLGCPGLAWAGHGRTGAGAVPWGLCQAIDQRGCAKPAAGQPASHVDTEAWLGWAGPGNLSHMALLLTETMDFQHFCVASRPIDVSFFDMRRDMRRMYIWRFADFSWGYAPGYAPYIYMAFRSFLICARVCAVYIYGVRTPFL